MKTLSELFDENGDMSDLSGDFISKERFIKIVEERDSELLLEYTEWWNTRDTITLVHTPEEQLIEMFLKERKGEK